MYNVLSKVRKYVVLSYEINKYTTVVVQASKVNKVRKYLRTVHVLYDIYESIFARRYNVVQYTYNALYTYSYEDTVHKLVVLSYESIILSSKIEYTYEYEYTYV